MYKVLLLACVLACFVFGSHANQVNYCGSCSSSCDWSATPAIFNAPISLSSDVSINSLVSTVNIAITSDVSIQSLTLSGARPISLTVAAGSRLVITGSLALNAGTITVYGTLIVGSSVTVSSNIIVAAGGNLTVLTDLSLNLIGSVNVQTSATFDVKGRLFVSPLAHVSLASCAASFGSAVVNGTVSAVGSTVVTVKGALVCAGSILLASGSELKCYSDSLITGSINVAVGATWNIMAGTTRCASSYLTVAGNLFLLGTLDLGTGVYNQASGLLRIEAGQLISHAVTIGRQAACSGFGRLVVDVITVAGTIGADAGGTLTFVGDFALQQGACIVENIISELVYGTIVIQKNASFAGSFLPIFDNPCQCLQHDITEPLINVLGSITNTGLQLLDDATNLLSFNNHAIQLAPLAAAGAN